MPADGLRAALYAKTEFRRPCYRQLEENLAKFFDSGKSRYWPPACRQCLLLALNGHANRPPSCPVLGE